MALLKTYSISTDITGGAVNEAKLHDEIDAVACVTNFQCVCVDGDNLSVHGASFSNEATCDTTVQDHTTTPTGDQSTLKYLKSPDGTLWKLSIDNAGVLSTTEI